MPNFAQLSLLGLLAVSAALAETRYYNFTIHAGEAAPDGFSRPVYLINGQQPAPLIEVDEGDTLEVFVKNDLPVETTLHWHGILQRGTPDMDGVPGVSQYPIVPGGNFTYRFNLENEYGFYWYHSHFRAYYNDAVRGPLLIRPDPSRIRPFEALASNTAEIQTMRQAERDALPVLLADWYHRSSDEVLQEYNRTGVFPHCVDSLLANGKGKVQCLPQDLLDCGTSLCISSDDTGSMSMSSSLSSKQSSNTHMPMASSVAAPPAMSRMSMMGNDMTTSYEMSYEMSTTMSGKVSMTMSDEMSMTMPLMHMSTANAPRQRKRQSMNMSNTMGMSGMSMSGMETALGPRGCTPPAMFRPGFNVSDLAPETCVETTAPLLQIPASTASGWLALHLVNAGATSKLTASLDSHTMFVYAADGLFVAMQEVEVLPIGIGERYSVMIRLDQKPGDYYLRFAATPLGDMQQVVESAAVVQYKGVASPSFMMAAIHPSSNSNASSDGLPSLLGTGGMNGVHMLLNSSTKPGQSTLNTSKLRPFDSIMPPRYTNATFNFDISQTGSVAWVVDRYGYTEPNTPILYGNVSDGWNANTTLHMPFNSSIDLLMRISPDSMDMMGHPMHLHGHKFWILGSGTGEFPYSSVDQVPSDLINLVDPPYRDTVELPPSGWAVIRYVSDNPGAWLFHCHIQWHLVSGMALVLVEGEDRLPALLQSASISSSSAGRFAPSSTGLGGGIVAITLALLLT